ILLNPADINIYSPESTVKDLSSGSGVFGRNQRMIYWRQNGGELVIDIIAPQGIDPRFLQFFVLHPSSLTGEPGFSIVSSQVYGVLGDPIDVVPNLQYLH